MSGKGIPGRGNAGKGRGRREHRGGQCALSGMSKTEGSRRSHRGLEGGLSAEHFRYCNSHSSLVMFPNQDSDVSPLGVGVSLLETSLENLAVSVTVVSITHTMVFPETAVPT